MTVTDPDVPDPLNDPRTLQADPGAYGQGEDLASTDDAPSATGEELTAGRDADDDAGGGDLTGGGVADATGSAIPDDESAGPPVVGGAWSEAPNT